MPPRPNAAGPPEHLRVILPVMQALDIGQAAKIIDRDECRELLNKWHDAGLTTLAGTVEGPRVAEVIQMDLDPPPPPLVDPLELDDDDLFEDD